MSKFNVGKPEVYSKKQKTAFDRSSSKKLTKTQVVEFPKNGDHWSLVSSLKTNSPINWASYFIMIKTRSNVILVCTYQNINSTDWNCFIQPSNHKSSSKHQILIDLRSNWIESTHVGLIVAKHIDCRYWYIALWCIE